MTHSALTLAAIVLFSHTAPVVSQESVPAGEGITNVYYYEPQWANRPPCGDLTDIGCLGSHGHLSTGPSCATFSSNGSGDSSVAGTDSLLHVVRHGGEDRILVLQIGAFDPGTQIWTTAGLESEGVPFKFLRVHDIRPPLRGGPTWFLNIDSGRIAAGRDEGHHQGPVGFCFRPASQSGRVTGEDLYGAPPCSQDITQ